MSRIKRWLNMHSKEFNADGTLKDEIRQQKIANGAHPGAVDSYAQRLKEEYDEWKHLDETDPEPWPVYTAYDFFTPEEKQQFNPDGTLKPEYVELARSQGISEGWLAEMERRQKIEVENYNQLSARQAEQGINYGAWLARSHESARRSYTERLRQMEVDLRNCEPPDSLPFDKDTPYF